MTIGIDKLGMYIPQTYLDLVTLAKARGVDPDKYTLGIGQKKMSIPAPNEDIVTMALEAAHSILDDHDRAHIDLILFASESAIDFSKAAGIYAHAWLGLKPYVRILEIKQACYASTGALRLALDYVAAHPDSKVLILSSDIAWYGYESSGEVTQGAGAIALTVSQNPRIALVNDGQVHVVDEHDFYRPSYSKVPVVDGKHSIKCYINILDLTQDQKAYPYTCFHMPFAAMANKANAVLKHPMNADHLELVKGYGQEVGNIYNGSLYLSLLSILHLSKENLSHQTIGMFAYGSGAIGEFFSLNMLEGYKSGLNAQHIEACFKNRVELSMEDYMNYMNIFTHKESAADYVTDVHAHSPSQTFVLSEIKDGHRRYQKVTSKQ